MQLTGYNPDAASGGREEGRRPSSPPGPRCATSTTACRCPASTGPSDVNKTEAAKYGASAATVGTAVQLVTNGLKITEYRPTDTDKSVDLIVRFPENMRNLDELEELRMNTPVGSVPIGNFVERIATPRVGQINRVAGQRVVTVSANLAEGVQSAVVQQALIKELAGVDLGPGVTFRMKGEDEEREKAGAFLVKAFGTAMFLIFAILLAQFNKFTSVLLVLSAVVLSTIGVLHRPDGDGAGVRHRDDGHRHHRQCGRHREQQHRADRHLRPAEARGRRRLRRDHRDLPRARAAGRAHGGDGGAGRAAIAFGINLDFVNREVIMGAPSTQWWIHLSTAIVFGLGFATVLTLVVTPAALMAIANVSDWRARRRVSRLARRDLRMAKKAEKERLAGTGGQAAPAAAE